MCLFNQADEKTKEANELRRQAIAKLKEGNAKEVSSTFQKVGAVGDKKKSSNLNKKGGFKITTEANLEAKKIGETKRENSLNTKVGKKRAVGYVSNSNRLKSLVLKEGKKGKGKNKKWTFTIRGEVG